MSRSFDAVGVVEAAYSLQGERKERLNRIGQALAAALPKTTMLVSGTYRVVDNQVVYEEDALVDLEASPPMDFEMLLSHQRRTIPGDVQIWTMSLADQWARGTWLYSSMVRDWGAENPVTRTFLEPLRSLGIQDCSAVLGRVGFQAGVFFCAHRTAIRELDDEAIGLLCRLSLHIAAGERLHRYLSGADATSESFTSEAVLSAEGRLLHAEGDAKERTHRESLRDRVRSIERARGRARREDGEKAVEAWKGLVDGTWSLVDTFDSDRRRFVVAHRNPSHLRDPRGLTDRERQVADLILLGRNNGEIAYALGLEVSTVTTHAANLGRKLKARTRPALVRTLRAAQRTVEDRAYGGLRVGSTSSQASLSPEEEARLSPAEREVFELAARGLTNREIGLRRGVGVPTVVKQMGSIYAKLGLSGREAITEREGDRNRSPPSSKTGSTHGVA